MTRNTVKVLVVGAGQSGLAASYHLKQQGIEHLVLEKGRPGESWLSQRWDSFVLNTPNSINNLPGSDFNPAAPGAFEPVDRLAEYFQRYICEWNLPIRTGVTVRSARRCVDDQLIEVRTDRESFFAENLIAASGAQNVPRIPGASEHVPASINSIHAADYRNPASLPPGNVLIVGTAQTGCQIAEELLDSDRQVFLATSRVGRVRRRLRGADIVDVMKTIGFLDQTVADLEDPAQQFAVQPVTTGVNGGHTVSLQSLWRSGATLLGRLESFEGSKALFGSNLRANIEFADNFSADVVNKFSAALSRIVADAPPLEEDVADEVDPQALELDAPTQLDLNDAGITSIIWATGFGPNFGWIEIDGSTDEQGRPVHTDGVSPAEGVFFLGVPWLRNRGSGIIFGADRDAATIVEHIAQHS